MDEAFGHRGAVLRFALGDVFRADALADAGGEEEFEFARGFAGDESGHGASVGLGDHGPFEDGRDGFVRRDDGLDEEGHGEARACADERWTAAAVVARLDGVADGAAALGEQFRASRGITTRDFLRPIHTRERGGQFGDAGADRTLDGRCLRELRVLDAEDRGGAGVGARVFE